LELIYLRTFQKVKNTIIDGEFLIIKNRGELSDIKGEVITFNESLEKDGCKKVPFSFALC